MKYLTIFLSLLAGFIGAMLYEYLRQNNLPQQHTSGMPYETPRLRETSTEMRTTKKEENPSFSYTYAPSKTIAPPSLVDAVEKSKESVVFIRTIDEREYLAGNWLNQILFGRPAPKVSTGSGVIFDKKGHIVTNAHVIEDADLIEVLHRNRVYTATLVGRDQSTDIAVIRLQQKDITLNNTQDKLPPIVLGNSEQLRVGEWVLAIGNPFNLTSTVTSGIVSAKGRNINILKGHFPIESFIQTDAAINPGNSGGALVNIKGQLVGINTAILSRTGYYAGYGFAIPVNLVKKIVNDLIEYAEVQRAFSGMTLKNIDTPMAEKLQIGALEGAIVTKIFPKGAAEKADIRLHDIIVAVNDKPINGNVAFEEIIGHSYPGDNLTLTIVRQKKSLQKNSPY